jgi:hypothetical protein
MFEPFMRSSRVNEVGQRKLVNMAQPLEGAGVDYLSLIGSHRNESVDGVAKFMTVLHRGVNQNQARGTNAYLDEGSQFCIVIV